MGRWGWEGGYEFQIPVMELVFLTFTKKVVLLIFKELVLLEKNIF